MQGPMSTIWSPLWQSGEHWLYRLMQAPWPPSWQRLLLSGCRSDTQLVRIEPGTGKLLFCNRPGEDVFANEVHTLSPAATISQSSCGSTAASLLSAGRCNGPCGQRPLHAGEDVCPQRTIYIVSVFPLACCRMPSGSLELPAKPSLLPALRPA